MSGIKIIRNGDHEYTIKTVDESVLGLEISDSSTTDIPQAFGMSTEVFKELIKNYIAFYYFQEAAENLEPDLPKMTKISCLVDFLKSNSFKKLNIKITTPNDYFLLGFIFSSVIEHVKGKDTDDLDGFIKFMKKMRGGGR
jgi:hypothetical protein